VSAPVLDGVRKAWDLAFELGDRSTAESIFGDLVSHNSPEQNEQATMRLQALAFDQLEDMGISGDDLENIAGAISHEMVDSGGEKLIDSLKSILEQFGMADDDEDSQAIQALAPVESVNPTGRNPLKPDSLAKVNLSRIGKELYEFGEKSKDEDRQRNLDYRVLSGYGHVLERMRGFGFLSAGNQSYRDFIERSAAMHGVSRLSLDGTFFFFGPSREDVSLFAHATAGEIGFPVLHVAVDLDAQGNGTIKLAGPFKRGFFGSPPDFIDMATPCTVLIENIDYLQEMFNNEQQAIKRSGGRVRGMMGPSGRSMQAEITAYLRALRRRPGVIVMATSQHGDILREPLRGLLGSLHEIEVGAPFEDERRDVLIDFAAEHPSFAELDIQRIARFSEGLSRSELVSAAHAAVESAYRESLRTGRYNQVTLGDVLMRLAPLIDHDSPLYQQMEDEAVIQLAQDMEKEMPSKSN
jgi:hypothetical protein